MYIMKPIVGTYMSLQHQQPYEGCLLYFGIREQKQILIIENRFIVFQSTPD